MNTPAQTTPTGGRIGYASALSNREKMLILVGVLLTLFLAALDQTIVATAQPAVVVQFQAIDLLSWVTSGYLLASTAMVPIFGKLSDLYGRKRVLMVGAVIFLIGSALCGTAQTMMHLIVYRVVQGVGAAGIVAVSMAIPADLWVPAERAKVSGLITSVFALAGIIGPFLGGLLTDQFTWRAVFYVNLPIGVIALLFVAAKMPQMASHLRAPIDWAGTTSLLAAVVPLLLALTLDKEVHGWSSPLVLGLFALSAASTLLFLFVETRAKSPLLPLSLFRNRVFTVAALASLTFGAAYFGSILYLAMFLVGVLGVSATKAGGALMPMMVGMVVGAVVSSVGAQRTGRYKLFLIGGVLVTTLGLWFMSQMDVSTTLGGVTWRMVILGIGVGPMVPLLSLSITNAVPHEQVGAAIASRTLFQNVGQTLAVAIFGVIMSTTLAGTLSIKMKPIVAGLPPSFQGKFDASQMKKNAVAEGGDGLPDVGAKIRTEITQAFAEQRALVTAAIKEDSVEAQQTLLANPEMPAELKQIFAPGGPEALAQQAGLVAFREQALERSLGALDAKEEELLKQGEAVGAEIGLAIRESFAASTTSIYGDAVYIALVTFMLLCALPEVPLKAERPRSGQT